MEDGIENFYRSSMEYLSVWRFMGMVGWLALMVGLLAFWVGWSFLTCLFSMWFREGGGWWDEVSWMMVGGGKPGVGEDGCIGYGGRWDRCMSLVKGGKKQ